MHRCRYQWKLLPGTRVILCPHADEFVEVMRPQDGGIPGQILKVVHDDSDKQVQHLANENTRLKQTVGMNFKLRIRESDCTDCLLFSSNGSKIQYLTPVCRIEGDLLAKIEYKINNSIDVLWSKTSKLLCSHFLQWTIYDYRQYLRLDKPHTRWDLSHIYITWRPP